MSSFSSSRLRGRGLTLALWAVAALLAAGITAALYLRPTEDEEVAEYIEQVNTTQQRFSTRYGSIDRTFREFRLSRDAAEEQLPELRDAARTLTQLRVSLAGVEAPADAAQLRTRLLAYLRQQEAVAYELVGVAAYLPKLGQAEAPLTSASKRLRVGLAASDPDDQAAAVQRYAVDLRRVAKLLEGIEAPELLAPSHRAYVRQLRAYAAGSEGLRRAIAANDQAAVDAAVARMETVATAPSGTARAQAAAIRAYNERVRRMRTLTVALEKERQRLERDL